ncbi:MAG: hypothetical protein RSE10_09330, partial [Oscillospiraceae bacterium]
FYSGFIVADKITVESRRAGAGPDQAVRWVSAGTGEFEGKKKLTTRKNLKAYPTQQLKGLISWKK